MPRMMVLPTTTLAYELDAYDKKQADNKTITGGWTHFKQVGVACVVDLNKQHMIWCDSKSDAWGDLRNPQQAQRAVTELLSTLSP